MSRRNERKLLAALDATNAALRHATEVTQATLELLAEVAAQRDKALATVATWRDLYDRKPRYGLLLVSTRGR